MKEIAAYRTRLKSVADALGGIAKAEIRGDGISSFVYAHTDDRAIELSQTEKGVWVEFWKEGDEPPEHDNTFITYEEATAAARDWLIGNGNGLT